MGNKTWLKLTAWIVLPAFFLISLPPIARAEMLSSESVFASEEVASARISVEDFLLRADVQETMVSYGVSPQDAAERVKSLSDDELLQLASTIQDAPAAGDTVVAVVTIFVVLFLVLVFTDILGLTKVFPFTRSIRR